MILLITCQELHFYIHLAMIQDEYLDLGAAGSDVHDGGAMDDLLKNLPSRQLGTDISVFYFGCLYICNFFSFFFIIITEVFHICSNKRKTSYA